MLSTPLALMAIRRAEILPARGRRGDGQRPRRVGASGERGRGGRCCLNDNGHYQS